MAASREDPDQHANAATALVEPLLPPSYAEETPPHPVVEFASDEPVSIVAVEQVTLDQELLFDNADESTWEHGEIQGPSCRNGIFALIFWTQVAGTATLAIMGVIALNTTDDWNIPGTDDGTDVDGDSFPVVRVLVFALSLMLSVMVVSAATMMLLLGALAEMMIQVSLVLSPLACGMGSLVSLVSGQVVLSIVLAVASLLGIWYAVRVWNRIPFAAANLATAMAAIKSNNKGLLVLAYAMALLAMFWTLVWSFALGQVTIVESEWVMECGDPAGATATGTDIDGCHLSTRGKWILTGLFLCFYWTSQVIKNVLHATVAGVVGTWWFTPPPPQEGDADNNDDGGLFCCGCNNALYDSWVRSTVYSFGSICLGSLLVAILQVVQLLVRAARQQHDEHGRSRQRQNSILWCLLQFVVDQLERLMEYINQWAFVYVGLYGYEYWTAGSKVYQLFQARGWSVIINDQLISGSLGMMQNFIGIISGGIAVLLGLVMLGFSISPLATFAIGWLLGIILSKILFQVVTSAVDTVVVCFAEAPSQLQENHPPELASRMIRAWRQVYPNDCGF